MVCVRLAWTTKKVLHCQICAGILTSSKDIQGGPDTCCWAGPTQCACRTPDKVCIEAAHLSCISSCSCLPRLIWLKDWQRLAMVIRTCCGHLMKITENMDIVEVQKACGYFLLGTIIWYCCARLGLRRGIAVAMVASRARSRNAIVSLLGPQR